MLHILLGTYKTKNASQLLDYCQLHGAGHSGTEGKRLRQWNCVTQSSSSSDCSFSLPNQRVGWIIHISWGIPTSQLTAFLRFPSWPGHHTLDFRDTVTLTRNMNVPRSTENMLLFYWEVSDGSRRTLLKRHQLPGQLQKYCSLCPLVHVCAAPSVKNPSSPLPGDAVSSSVGSLPPRGPGNVLTLCPVLKAWETKLGFLANSFLQQIFIGFLLCPHHSSPSCQGRQACG